MQYFNISSAMLSRNVVVMQKPSGYRHIMKYPYVYNDTMGVKYHALTDTVNIAQKWSFYQIDGLPGLSATMNSRYQFLNETTYRYMAKSPTRFQFIWIMYAIVATLIRNRNAWQKIPQNQGNHRSFTILILIFVATWLAMHHTIRWR